MALFDVERKSLVRVSSRDIVDFLSSWHSLISTERIGWGTERRGRASGLGRRSRRRRRRRRRD